jgi:hypothetical protein
MPETIKKSRPAKSPEARENQMIALAVNLAEKQLRDGSASSQVISHYIKLATTEHKLNKDILASKKLLMDAKTESIQSAKRVEELYEQAIVAMKDYQGQGDEDDE